MSQIFEENGVKIAVNKNHATPEKTDTFYNPRMTICREISLSVLSAFCSELEDKTPECLDAFSATGISGLQWKKHLGHKIKVTVNDANADAVQNIKDNCALNGVEFHQNVEIKPGNDQNGGPDVIDSGEKQEDLSKVEVFQADANVLLYLRSFDFVNLDPYGCAVHFLESAFRNTRNGGIIVITSTDVASLYGKCSHVGLRNYGAYVVKTDYMKEMAARMVLGAAARCATRCNKGFEVLVSIAVEHFVLVAVRICRGPKYADAIVPLVQRVLHCQICEERVFYPPAHTPVEAPYTLLACDCTQKYPGKTALDLGPVWIGKIFSCTFISKMLKSARNLKLSSRLCSLLETVHCEASCPDLVTPRTLTNHSHPEITDEMRGKESGLYEGGQNESLIEKTHNQTQGCVNISELEDAPITSNFENVETTKGVTNISQGETSSSLKRKSEALESPEGGTVAKKRKPQTLSVEDPVPFYYSVHRHRIKGVDLPKAPKLVKFLQSEGYCASRTHFDPTAVKTSANLSQLKAVLLKHCKTVDTT
ncbi:TRMT1-like protein isoform X2 [Lingula anatina]|nr:TRMT1-like protein isoform X2 [Lingula anatina]XP_013415142.1 TRMT1-like protein isoform X2 [Lingula anatina]XP_013415143.1 TRMT1-like protein isoform X2 [Lingula anatina]|eukprot:XP_013415141.1 TRMT1-like protein isoform X2 [Lingula anatina]